MNELLSRSVRRLRTAWIANAVFSSLCAAAFLAAAPAIAGFCGTAVAEVRSTGVVLLIFVGLLVLAITRPDPTRAWVLGLAIVLATLDVLWVLGTPGGLAGHTTGGKWMLSGIAVVVAVLAAMQIAALVGIFRGRRSARALGASG